MARGKEAYAFGMVQYSNPLNVFYANDGVVVAYLVPINIKLVHSDPHTESRANFAYNVMIVSWGIFNFMLSVHCIITTSIIIAMHFSSPILWQQAKTNWYFYI